MRNFALKENGAVAQMRQLAGLLLVLTALIAGAAAPAGLPTEDGVKAFAMYWFAPIQAGKIDRPQYAADYSAQLNDDAVRTMSRHLNQYGASPLRAEIMRKRVIGNQTFYVVKFIFPRGDSASILFGFDTDGKITGIGVESMAGD